jgi:hypothetical protein
MPNDTRLNRRREDPMARKGWLREFDDPIALPDGKKLATLHDAATYTELLRNEFAAPERRTAI